MHRHYVIVIMHRIMCDVEISIKSSILKEKKGLENITCSDHEIDRMP
jgi:hypothetical protein